MNLSRRSVTLGTCAFVLTLSACGNDEERAFAGRWSHNSGGHVVNMTVSFSSRGGDRFVKLDLRSPTGTDIFEAPYPVTIENDTVVMRSPHGRTTLLRLQGGRLHYMHMDFSR